MELGEATKSAQDDGAAIEGREEVVVYKTPEILEARDDCLVPAFVALSGDVRS